MPWVPENIATEFYNSALLINPSSATFDWTCDMPIPEKVQRQDGSQSCGYHALANAINVLEGQGTITPEALMNGPEQSVNRLAPGTLNQLLAEKNLFYKATTPMNGDKPMPIADALRTYGADGVFIVKVLLRSTDHASGDVTEDKHAVVVAGFAPSSLAPAYDTWEVLDSGIGPKFTIMASENFRPTGIRMLDGVQVGTRQIIFEGCQVLESSDTPGGAAAPSGFKKYFADLFAGCCCFGKSRTA